MQPALGGLQVLNMDLWWSPITHRAINDVHVSEPHIATNEFIESELKAVQTPDSCTHAGHKLPPFYNMSPHKHQGNAPKTKGEHRTGIDHLQRTSLLSTHQLDHQPGLSFLDSSDSLQPHAAVC